MSTLITNRFKSSDLPRDSQQPRAGLAPRREHPVQAPGSGLEACDYTIGITLQQVAGHSCRRNLADADSAPIDSIRWLRRLIQIPR